MIEVFKTIYENKSSHLTLLAVLKKAFDEEDNIELIKLRCQTIRELEAIEEELEIEQEEIDILNDLKVLLLQTNLDRPIHQLSNLITKGHYATIKTIYKLYSTSLNIQTKQELEEIYKNLPKEDIEFLDELKLALDDFFIEFKVRGNKAYKTLLLKVTGILALYRTEIMKSKYKDIFKDIYQKLEFATNFSDTLYKIANNGKRLIELFE